MVDIEASKKSLKAKKFSPKFDEAAPLPKKAKKSKKPHDGGETSPPKKMKAEKVEKAVKVEKVEKVEKGDKKKKIKFNEDVKVKEFKKGDSKFKSYLFLFPYQFLIQFANITYHF